MTRFGQTKSTFYKKVFDLGMNKMEGWTEWVEKSSFLPLAPFILPPQSLTPPAPSSLLYNCCLAEFHEGTHSMGLLSWQQRRSLPTFAPSHWLVAAGPRRRLAASPASQLSGTDQDQRAGSAPLTQFPIQLRGRGLWPQPDRQHGLISHGF